MAVYSRWQATITDGAGNVVPGASVEVADRLAVGLPLVTLYADRAGGTVIGNPIAADSVGYVGFHVAPGVYRIRAYLGPTLTPTFERIWDYVDIGVDLAATYAWTGYHTFTQPVTLSDITGDGSAARSWALGRHPTGAGSSLTLAAGGAHAGVANLAGGDLVLAAGISTGNQGAAVVIKAPPSGQSSGSADRTQVEVARFTRAGNDNWLSLRGAGDYTVFCNPADASTYWNTPTGGVHSLRVANAEVFTVGGATLAVKPTTASTSTTTGALTVAGGVGIAQDVWTGGYIAAAGNIATSATTASTSSTTGALRSAGGLGVTGDVNVGGFGNFATYVASPQVRSPLIVGGSGTTGAQLTFQTTSGAGTTDTFAWWRGNAGGTLAMRLNNNGLQIGGGANTSAVNGDITLGRSGTTGVMYFGSSGGSYVYFDGTQYNITHVVAVASTTASTSTTSGSGTFAGGIGVVGDVNVGGYLAVAGNISGALKVTSLTGIGYRAGAGGTVTQSTSKATAVTLNKATGEITTPNDSLAANTTTTFTLNNNLIEAADMLAFNVLQGTAGGYAVNAKCAAGSATIELRNVTAGTLSENVKIRFALIKAATT